MKQLFILLFGLIICTYSFAQKKDSVVAHIPSVLTIKGNESYWDRRLSLLNACQNLLGEGNAPYSQIKAAKDSVSLFLNEILLQLKSQIVVDTVKAKRQ